MTKALALSPDELRRLAAEGAAGAKPIRSFPAMWADEAQLPVTAHAIVKGLIAAGDLVVCYGPSGCGKTFFAADLCFDIALGRSWRGRNVKRQLVVYVAPEAGRSILKRFVALRERRLGEAYEDRIPLAILTAGPNLLNGVDVETLIAQVRALQAEIRLPVGAVVFDTLSRSIPGGDENRSEDMTALVAVADRIRDELGAATMLVHHSGKDVTRGARGHSSLFAAADVVLAVADGTATVEKIRDGMAGETFAFRLEPVVLGEDADGDPITTCIVEHLNATAPRQAVRQAQLSGVGKVALQALEEAIGEHGEFLPVTSSIPAGARGITLTQWRERFRLRYGEGDERDAEAVRKAFQRAREALLKVGAIGISNPYVWVSR